MINQEKICFFFLSMPLIMPIIHRNNGRNYVSEHFLRMTEEKMNWDFRQ